MTNWIILCLAFIETGLQKTLQILICGFKGVAHSWSVDNVNQNNVNRENSCRYRTFYRLGNIYKSSKLSDVFDMKVVTK